ncbi:hypothetical protein EHF33_06775 [Deinococcus psychrotolerans]|uniref:Uncharacterized protein n=2 Tax=Deinococcus TaxID=1298 RepID=A0A553V1W3_9DEIO|nr:MULTISPECIES: hypothetical protein [Deinococcus]AZI42489.1 hypothetical protein EHF33_06775 [Deinococcus psychrotolerans]TSA86463.1 hypothetical protein FNU79_07390 [Deinococcus detaillensis]
MIRARSLLLWPLLSVVLSGCLALPAIEPRTLNFKAGPIGSEIKPATLLETGLVPADKLVSVAEALARAPEGSLLLPCWRTTVATNFWGPCSHLARKLGQGQMADQPGLTQTAGIRPTDTLLPRYAVIVLDVGVTSAQYFALERAAEQLKGQPYSFSGAPNTSYCTTYQNELQQALNQPDVIPFNPAWNGYLPADALDVPGVKVLWVGVNEAST